MIRRRIQRFLFVHQDGIAVGVMCLACLILGFAIGMVATIQPTGVTPHG